MANGGRLGKVLLPLAAVAVVGALLVVRCSVARQTDPAERAKARLNVSKIPLDPSARPARLTAAIGERRRYQLTLDNRTKLDLASLSGRAGAGEQVVEMSLTGTWLMHAFGNQGDDLLVHVRLQLDALRVVNAGVVVTGAALDDIRRVVASSVVVRVAPNGAIKTLRLPPELDADPRALGLVKSVIVAMQIVYGEGAGPGGWQVAEQDGAGDYLAAYEWTSTGELVKRKLKYTAMANTELPAIGDGLEIKPKLAAVFQLDTGGWVGTLLHDESFAFEMAGMGSGQAPGKFKLETTTHLEVGLLERERITEAELPPAWQRWPERPLADATVASRAADEDADELRKAGLVSLDSLLGELGFLVKGGIDTVAMSELERKFMYKFRAQPDAAAQAVKRILDGTMSLDESRVVLQALGQAGKPPHQAALVSVLNAAQLPSQVRTTALTALQFAPQPTLESLSAVHGLIGTTSDDTLDKSALLAYGHMAGNMGRDLDAEPPQQDAAAAAIDDLLARYHAAGGLEDRLLLLGAIGNSGHPRALSLLLELTRSEEAPIRDAAIRGLRFQTADAADAVLREVATSHPAESARDAAIFAIGFRPFAAYLELLLVRLRDEPVEALAAAVVRLLAPHLERVPAIREAFEWASTNSPHREVREQTAEVLAAHPARP